MYALYKDGFSRIQMHPPPIGKLLKIYWMTCWML